MLTFEQLEVENPIEQPKIIEIWLTELVEAKNYKVGELTYYFCNDSKILEANREFLSHDYFTDVITFDASVGEVVSADILISLETVASNAEKYEVAFDQELHRVMAHAVLHLIGYDDKEESLQKEMRKAEDEALVLLEKMRRYV